MGDRGDPQRPPTGDAAGHGVPSAPISWPTYSPDGYPLFSAAETARRRHELTSELSTHGLDHALLYGAGRSGSAIQWLTGWPVTTEAVVVVSPGERDVLFVRFDNHVPNARRLAPGADVRPGGGSALGAALDLLARRVRRAARVGVIGPLPARPHERLAAIGTITPLDQAYARLRLIKSAEELGWLRIGAVLTDRAVAALAEGAGPGVSETEACAMLESAYIPAGAVTHLHYLGATPMAQPRLCVPAQWPSSRRLHPGDALTCEVSASYWGYPGQLLRTFAVAAEPSRLYRHLHDVAETAFDAMAARLRPGATAAELLDAASVILDAGYTVYDDLVHGFGGGYLAPVLSRADLQTRRTRDFTFAAGMTVVIQPNVITRDEQAGVQAGELVVVTETGWASLHRYPRGLTRIG